MVEHQSEATALQQARHRVLELLDKVNTGAGQQPQSVRHGWVDDNDLEDEFYETIRDSYTELRESIDLLFQFVEQEHRTNISLARQLGAAEERRRSQLTDEQARIAEIAAKPIPENRLWKHGNVWYVTYNGDTRKLGKLLGMLYIGYALEHPGPTGIKMLHIEMTVYGKTDVYSSDDAMDAHAEIAGGNFEDEGYDDEEHESSMRYADYDEITSTGDAETLQGYREARRELERQIYAAQEASSTAEVERLQRERDEIDGYIRRLEQSTKRGTENEGDSKEHIKRVREAAKYTLDQLPSKHPALAKHFDEALRIESNSIAYDPATSTRWRVDRSS